MLKANVMYDLAERQCVQNSFKLVLETDGEIATELCKEARYRNGDDLAKFADFIVVQFFKVMAIFKKAGGESAGADSQLLLTGSEEQSVDQRERPRRQTTSGDMFWSPEYLRYIELELLFTDALMGNLVNATS
ncbi:hypothetical protein scyTo_0008437 [Scyliorhinus torazame]|uniref:Uncharacterized protein n=1 Tax=Scyliorhinus torazame TaxID=75743 RepID=A0A401P995_SCYTO|nr:hypothetical protein [Scyliorhinus torazame]